LDSASGPVLAGFWRVSGPILAGKNPRKPLQTKDLGRNPLRY
jgi:hypothetical protein